jgi:hypothetical protein
LPSIEELAAHYVLLNVALTAYFTLPLGISIAASIRVGQLIGQGHVRTAQLTSKLVAALGAGFMSLSGLTVTVARNSIGYLFSSDPAVVAQVARIAPICGIFQTFDGIQGSTGGVLRGLGLQRWAAVINCVGLWCLGVPMGYLLCFSAGIGLPGLWWGLFIGLFVVATGNLLLLWRADWYAQVAAAQERIQLDEQEYEKNRQRILEEVEQQQQAEQSAEGTTTDLSAPAAPSSPQPQQLQTHIIGDYSEAIEAERRNEQRQKQQQQQQQVAQQKIKQQAARGRPTHQAAASGSGSSSSLAAAAQSSTSVPSPHDSIEPM